MSGHLTNLQRLEYYENTAGSTQTVWSLAMPIKRSNQVLRSSSRTGTMDETRNVDQGFRFFTTHTITKNNIASRCN
jgi:hypothetical protein